MFSAMWVNPEIKIYEIARKFKRSDGWVYLKAKRLGLPEPSSIRRQGAGAKRWHLVQHYDAMLADRLDGMSFNDIAKKYGCSRRAVYTISQRQNWQKVALPRGGRRTPKVKGAPAPTGGKKAGPSLKSIEDTFSLRRLDAAQVAAVGKTGGCYAAIEALAKKWGKQRNFVMTCWHEWKAISG